MPSSRAVSGRTTTACRCSSARAIAARWCAPQPPATRSSFSAPTARRTPATPRKRAAAAPGCYTAHAGIELYAEAFEAAGALNRLEAFASWFGADFYELPRNQDRLTLRKAAWEVPQEVAFGSDRLVPMGAGEVMQWQVA